MLNLLVSWPYLAAGSLKEFIFEHRSHIRLLLDSGAFTNWKKGVETDVVDYIKFVNGLDGLPWRYFVLDKIGDSMITQRNTQTMLDAGLTPVPIFTRGTDIEVLDGLYEFSDLVGLGVGVKTKQYLNYVRWVVERNDGRPLHWLGVSNTTLVAQFRPFSLDCTTWTVQAMYGKLEVYMGNGKFIRLSRTQLSQRNRDQKLRQAFNKLGFNVNEFQKESAWSGAYSGARFLGAASWIRFMLETEHHFGTKIFMAIGSRHEAQNTVDQYFKLKGITCNDCSYHREQRSESPSN